MKIFGSCAFILCTAILIGCNNKGKELEQSITADSVQVNSTGSNVESNSVKDDTPPMSGWKCYGLLGRVKSVKYTDGNYWEFNKDGNLTKKITIWVLEDGGKYANTVTNIYLSLNEYTVTDGTDYKIKIEYEKNTRNEIEQGGEYFRDSFTFDKQGRLSKYHPNVDFDALTIEYKYKSETDFFPYKKIMEASYEGGGGGEYTVSTFEYLKTDTKGNWIERKVISKTSGEDEEGKKSYNTETTIEKREITYF